MLNAATEDKTLASNNPRVRSKSRTRWKKIRQTRERHANCIDEETDEQLNNAADRIFERIITVEMKMESFKDTSAKLFNLTKLVRSIPKSERTDNNQNVLGIVSKVKKSPEILNYKNTIYNLNWRERRDVPGYYGCGDCFVCRVSIFGDKFKVNNSGGWFKIKDCLDCESPNVLYLATCTLCPDNIQYGSYATDLKKRIKGHKEETENMSQMKDPVGDGLSLHFFTVHGGWYEDGARFQAVKQIQQGEFTDMAKALEAKERSMLYQLDLYAPRGLNLRHEDVMARRMSQSMTFSKRVILPLVPDKDSSVVKSRWSRLDYFRIKPTKLEELTDVARILLMTKREEEKEQKNAKSMNN